MEQLKHAIAMAGGVTALAREMNISQPRISNWISRGVVPDGWLAVLSMRYPMPELATPAKEAAPPKPAEPPAQPAQPPDLSATELDEAGLVDRRETVRRTDDLKAGKGGHLDSPHD